MATICIKKETKELLKQLKISSDEEESYAKEIERLLIELLERRTKK